MHITSIKKFILIFFLCTPLLCFSNETVIRAAIDIGSGATKLRIAEVDLKTQKIVKILDNESFTVQYQEELEKSSNNTFNDNVMQIGLEALKKSKEVAQKYHAENVIAVATASFRKAANVQEFIDKIYQETGIKVYIIDQNLEGILAFSAASAVVNDDPTNLIVWDIGGGSFQFSTLDDNGHIVVYRGVDASIPFKNHVIKYVKMEDPNKVSTPNPITQKELRETEYYSRQIARKVDEFFKEKINSPATKIVGIGNIFYYRIFPLVGKKSPFTERELFLQVQNLVGVTDKEIGGDYANVGVTNPILILGFMETLGIDEMQVIDINNADGALVYPEFWKDSPKTVEIPELQLQGCSQ